MSVGPPTEDTGKASPSCFRITYPHRAGRCDGEHTPDVASLEERPGLCGVLRKTVSGLSLQLWFVQEENIK